MNIPTTSHQFSNPNACTRAVARLDARVTARNKCNLAANSLATTLRARLAPFIGKKVITVDGVLTKAAQKALDAHPFPAICNAASVRWYRVRSAYGNALHWEVCVSAPEAGQDCCFYTKGTVRIGATGDDGKLIDLPETTPFRTDYTVQEIWTAREEYHRLRDATRAAEWACQPFGTVDSY